MADERALDDGALMFLSDHEARTVEAIAERIIPTTDDAPGATEAGVVYYIDRAIAGFSQRLQPVYQAGLVDLDRFCQSERGSSFVGLQNEAQDDVVRRFLGPATGDAGEGLLFSRDDQPPSDEVSMLGIARLFAVIREHTVEGFFCDPAYGGNRHAVGWKLVGFPGAHWGYSEEQMAANFDGRSLPIMTLADLRAERAEISNQQEQE